jgi:hypothetical protein
MSLLFEMDEWPRGILLEILLALLSKRDRVCDVPVEIIKFNSQDQLLSRQAGACGQPRLNACVEL